MLAFLSTLFAPKGWQKAAAEIISGPKKDPEDPAAPQPVTAPFAPPPPFRTAGDMRRDFDSRNHHANGYADGHLLHSHETYQDTTNMLVEEHKQICVYEIVEKKDEIYKTEIDLDNAGPNSAMESMCKRKLAKLNAELTELETELAKDHHNDPTSKCQPAIKAYRKGHNEGLQKYFLTSGAKS